MIVEELKKSVLEHAMRGKLSKHHSDDSNIDSYLQDVRNNEYIKLKDVKKQLELEIQCPDNWAVVKLGSIAGVYGGKRIPAGRRLVNEDTGHKYIRVADMNDYTVELTDIKYVSEDIYESIKKYTISKEDLYITVAGTIGKVGYIPEELDGANLTENANKIVFKNIDQKWLFYALSSPLVQKQIREMTTKVGQPKLAIMRIVNIEIPIPVIEEQRRIVKKIDDIFEKIDEIKPIEQRLENLKNVFPDDMKKSVLEYAMSGKMTNSEKEWKDSYKSLWEVTAWDKKFKEVDNSHQKKVCKYKYYLASEMTKLKKDEGNVYLLSTGNFEGWTTEDAVGDYLAEGEVVAIPWGGSPSIKYYKGKFVTTDNRIATSLDTDILSNKFLYYYMQSKIQYLDTIYRGTSLRHPSMKAILDMKIPVPPINEQKKIVEKIEEVLPLLEAINNR